MQSNQTEYLGVGSLNQLDLVLNQFKAERIFLVTGKKSFVESGAKELLVEVLAKKTVHQFSDFQTNPDLKDIKNGIAEFKNFAPDIVIAIGGGTAIDVAKAINILAANSGDPQVYIIGENKITESGRPLVAVPTTSGSGSEATHFAVVYVDGIKYSLAHQNILPTVAIVDPRLTFNLSAKQTAVSGADALCQAIESYWAVGATDESKSCAKQALRLALDNLEAVVTNPTEMARTAMSEAAHLAGKAINISKTTASHALSYPLTTHLGLPHGQAVALTLPLVLRYNSQVQGGRAIDELVKICGVETVEQMAGKLEVLFQAIGFSLNLRDFKLTLADIETFLDEASLERMNNNPRKITQADAQNILSSLI